MDVKAREVDRAHCKKGNEDICAWLPNQILMSKEK